MVACIVFRADGCVCSWWRLGFLSISVVVLGWNAFVFSFIVAVVVPLPLLFRWCRCWTLGIGMMHSFLPFVFWQPRLGLLAALRVFSFFCGGVGGVGGEAEKFLSVLLIALSISFMICCSMLFWLDGVMSWMASAVASVAVSISSHLNFVAIIDCDRLLFILFV